MNLTPEVLLANRHLAPDNAAVIDEMAVEWQRLKALVEAEGVTALLSEVTAMDADDARAMLIHGLILSISAEWPTR